MKEDEDEESDNEDLALLMKKLFRKGRHSSFKRNSGCFNCGKKDHFSKECPKPKKESKKESSSESDD